MSRYLLDTNICIYLMRQVPLSVVERFEQCRWGDIRISAITLAELQSGANQYSADPSRIQRIIHELTDWVPVLPFDTMAAEQYGLLYQRVRSRKRDALDRLIAAHAIASNRILVTNNEDDFRDYPGLVVENWVDPAG